MLKFVSKLLLAKKAWDWYAGRKRKKSGGHSGHKDYTSYWD